MTTKILIADDEPTNLATLEALLAGEGYELHFAENGRDACAKAEIEKPDLILLDVMMPEMDGFAVTRHLRADSILGRIPIILVTALDDERSRVEGLRAGADDFLTKPCRREELRARVRTVARLNRFRLIAEQRERFEHLFAAAPGAIVLTDATGQVLAANPLARAHRIGASIFAVFGELSAAVLRALLRAALDGEPAVPGQVCCGPETDEQTLQVRAVVVPEGDARCVMFVFDDITPEIHARAAVERMNARLEELVHERTRQLEESNALLLSYAGFVSHDLRSPLTAVKGYLSLLHEGVMPLDETAAPIIAHAYNGAVIMQELIQNILQLAQDEHDSPHGGSGHETDPTPVVQRLAMHLREIFPQPAPRLAVAKLPQVGVSAVLVERVFYNLIANALKYSAQRAVPTVTIFATECTGNPVIAVRDNGVGFDQRDADKLFRQFSRLPSAAETEGFGLGLSLVARLLRAHGGRIWAEGKVGVGATFFVQFPGPVAHSGICDIVGAEARV